ncbi:hypothetical protein ABEY43_07240 [Priestia megaterium]
MKVAYYGEIRKEQINLKGVYVLDYTIDTANERRLLDMIKNPDEHLYKYTSFDGYKYIKEDDVDSDFVRYIKNNGSIKIEGIDCYIRNVAYNTVEERLDVYTNYISEVVEMPKDDYEFMVNQQIEWWTDGLDRQRKKNKELIEAKNESTKKEEKPKKKWYEIWK